MSEITTVGLDLAKSVFHVVCCDLRGKVIRRKKLSRSQVCRFFAQLAPCLVGMEACSTSHYWARELIKLGHEVKQIPTQHVKAFLRGNKNDYNDALAIAVAVVMIIPEGLVSIPSKVSARRSKSNRPLSKIDP